MSGDDMNYDAKDDDLTQGDGVCFERHWQC